MNYEINNNIINAYVDNNANITISEYLKSLFIGKKEIHKIICNYLLVNGNKVSANYILQINDLISVNYQHEQYDFVASKSTLDIVYEDDLLLVVNKPTKIIIHPENKDGIDTLANNIAYYFKCNNIKSYVRAIHRLDYETRGLIVYCKISFFLPLLDNMLANKLISREYLCIAKGKANANGIINKPIGRDRHNSKKYLVSKNGKDSTTLYKIVKYFPDHNVSLIHCTLKTGRTHQIRVHLSSIGLPLLNDPLYGINSKLICGMGLQAYKLTMTHPLTNQKLVIEIPLDERLVIK